MNTVNALVESVKEKLDKSNNASRLVGNRMHFPMLIHYCGNRAAEVDSHLRITFSRIWPQTSDNIVFIHSPIGSGSNSKGMFLNNPESSEEQLTVEQIQKRIDTVRSHRGIFASMMKWCVYIILDTSSVENVEEFKACCNKIEEYNSIVDGGTSTMLIVLLNESSSKKESARLIREELSDNHQFDGVVVVSNKTINSELFLMEELYDIVAGTIILSNNDAVSQTDDDDYRKRVSALFGGNTLTLAYSSLKRPNKRIGTQIINAIIERVFNQEILGCKTISEDELVRRLGIQNGSIRMIENGLKEIDIPFPETAFSALPFKRIPSFELNFNSVSYAELSDFLHENVFDTLIKAYCGAQAVNRIQVQQILKEYEFIVRNAITAAELVNVSDDLIGNVIGQIEIHEPNKGLPAVDYFKNYSRYYIKRQVVIPKIKDLLLSLRNSSAQTLECFNRFRTEFQKALPVEGFSELGTVYLNIAENYFNTTKGEESLKSMIAPANDDEAFACEIMRMVDGILASNASAFSLPFIDEWERRLNLAGEEIYKQIQTTFEQDFDQRLFLFGNYQRNQVALEVYMFHTSDATGQMSTGLYNHLKKAMNAMNQAQFVNTGCDDIVEAFRFIDCSGKKLLL